MSSRNENLVVNLEKAEELRKQPRRRIRPFGFGSYSPSQIWIIDLMRSNRARRNGKLHCREEIAGEMKAQKKNAKHQAKQKTCKEGNKKK
jgi:hypothetical protein